MHHRVAFAIFALVLGALAILTPQDPFNSQIITRMGLTLSMLEDHEVTIDRFAGRTIDKAQWNGHFYADKTPGHALLALPAAAAAEAIVQPKQPATGLPDDATWRSLTYWTTLGTNGVLSALTAAVLFLTAIRLGAAPGGALLSAVGLAFATPFLGWSTAFFAHSVSGSLMFLAFAVATRLTVRLPGEAPPSPWLGGLLGLLLGYVLVVDLTSAPVVAIGGIALLIVLWRQRTTRFVPMLLAIFVGGLIGLLPLPIYNVLAFGSPVRLGYANVTGFEGMHEGFFGITVPNPIIILALLFGLYRGLLAFAPLLFFVPLGLIRMGRITAAGKRTAWTVAVVGMFYLAINSSYHYWNGGWSTGPRHLVPTLPFLALSLAFAWPKSRHWRVVFVVLFALSLAISAVSAATDMFAPGEYHSPLFKYLIPLLVHQASSQARFAGVAVIWLAVAGLAWWLHRAVQHRRPLDGAAAPEPV